MEEIEEEEEEEVTSVCEVIWAVLVEEATELVVVDDVVLGITSVDEIEVELSTVSQHVLQSCMDIPISDEVVEDTNSSLEVVEDTAAVD